MLCITFDRDKLVLGYLNNVQSKLELRFLSNGTLIQNFPLEIGTVNSYSGKRNQDEFFFNFVSFLAPGTVFHVDFTKEPLTANLFKEVKAPGFDATKFITKQVFYPSKDGTKVPMFITHRKVRYIFNQISTFY
jgi:prolyl oligopeptidase